MSQLSRERCAPRPPHLPGDCANIWVFLGPQGPQLVFAGAELDFYCRFVEYWRPPAIGRAGMAPRLQSLADFFRSMKLALSRSSRSALARAAGLQLILQSSVQDLFAPQCVKGGARGQ